jgi:hypothetical protein
MVGQSQKKKTNSYGNLMVIEVCKSAIKVAKSMISQSIRVSLQSQKDFLITKRPPPRIGGLLE